MIVGGHPRRPPHPGGQVHQYLGVGGTDQAPAPAVLRHRPPTSAERRTGRETAHAKRWADLYVFIHLHSNESTQDASMDKANWTFYLVPTDVLDKRLDSPTQKRVSLARVRSLRESREVPANELRTAVRAELARREPRGQPWPPR